jgi:hypothetical protein
MASATPSVAHAAKGSATATQRQVPSQKWARSEELATGPTAGGLSLGASTLGAAKDAVPVPGGGIFTLPAGAGATISVTGFVCTVL